MELSLTRRARWAVVLFAALLAACGGAPSNSEINEAVGNQTKADAAAMKGFAGNVGASMFKSLIPEIKSVKKIGCRDDGQKAYRCDVELEVAQAGRTSKIPANLRFVKGSDGWLVQR